MVLDLRSGESSVRVVDSTLNVEFSRVHPDFAGAAARYGFSGIMDGGDARFGGVAKWEMRRGGGGLAATVRFGDNVWGGEPVVVPKEKKGKRPAGAEGDGSDDCYIITFVHDEGSDRSYVSVIDGERMVQVARLATPRRVPYGLHGQWVREAELRDHIRTSDRPLPG